jgi:hypothetical protein
VDRMHITAPQETPEAWAEALFAFAPKKLGEV